MNLSKYIQIFKISWSEGLVYRLNFVMWRIRSIFHFFVVYFLWFAIFNQQDNVFGYQAATMLTYVLGTAILRSFVLASRSQAVNVEIATGDLNNYLVRPLNYFINWFFRDLADKALNFSFIIIEMSLVILILKPPIILPENFISLLIFLLAVILAMFIFFFFSFIVGCFAFWYPEHNGWPLRFIVFIAVDFLAGTLFPLDIFPSVVFNIFRFLPPAYFIFYPMQVYLGRLSSNQTLIMFFIMAFWLIALFQLAKFVWQKGLKKYAAYGR